MPTNLHALIRYRTIDRCLRRRHRQWTWQDLARACGDELRDYLGEHIDDPSRRTIFVDIKHMKSGKLGYEAPIVFDRRSGSYRYADPDFSISNSPLGPEDHEELRHALHILRQFRGFRHMQGIEQIIAKLDFQARRAADPRHDLLQLDHAEGASGQEWSDLLYRGAYRRQTLRIDYKPFFEEGYAHIFSPYLLKEYNNRWFLIAYNHERGRLENLALDRIRDVAPAEAPFHALPGFDPRTYFRDVVGPSRPDGGRLETIRFRATPDQAPYIETKPLHASQRVLRRGMEGVVFQIEVMPNFELESRLLAFGERVEVLTPASFRQKLAERVRAMAEKYRPKA